MTGVISSYGRSDEADTSTSSQENGSGEVEVPVQSCGQLLGSANLQNLMSLTGNAASRSQHTQYSVNRVLILL